jgi:cytochrome b561
MPASDSDARYTRTAVALHWVIAVLVIGQFAWGWWMQQIPKQPIGPRVDAFNLHKSVGLVILALMLVRIGWRIAHAPPPLPAMPSWQARMARITHVALYVLLIVQPLSGYLGSEVSGYPVKFFGLTLPGWAGRNVGLKDFLSGVHLATSWMIAGAVGLHVAGALKHALIDRDGLLSRMGFGRVRDVRSTG